MKNERMVILYERGVVQKLAKAFGVTPMTVRSALKFATDGDLPDRIREEALKYYNCALMKKPIIRNTVNQ